MISNRVSDQVVALVSAQNPEAIHLGVIAQSRKTGKERYFLLITDNGSLSAVVAAIRWHCGEEWQVYETFDVTPPTDCSLTVA